MQERPRVLARARGYAVADAPVRLPQGGLGAAPQVRARSVFDEAVRGAGAQVRQVPLLGGPPLLRPQAPQPQAPRQARTVVVARMGQAGAGTPPPQAAQERTAVERVIQRDMPPVGLSRQEAAAVASALGPALEASTAAVAEGVACGRVNSFMVQEVRVLADFLSRFAAVARADERTDRLSADDFSKIDEVLACQAVYEQVSAAKDSGKTALLVGGLVVGVVALALLT